MGGWLERGICWEDGIITYGEPEEDKVTLPVNKRLVVGGSLVSRPGRVVRSSSR